MSTDDASKLKSSCSRSCLGRVWSCLRDVSVLVLRCLGHWVMSRGVTVMSPSCFRNALLMSRGCRGDVSVVSC